MIHIVGAGSGAADLVTLRGARLLRAADVVVWAGSLVNPELLAECKESCVVYDSAHMTLEEVLDVMCAADARGEEVVRLHTGDPCLYGAIQEQMDALDARGVDYEVVPGVSSFCGAAAALRQEYTLPGISQSVVITRLSGRTPMPAGEGMRTMAESGSTMVIFLSSGMLAELSAELLAAGRSSDEPAALVYKATWPEERVVRCTVGTLADAGAREGIDRTALVVVGFMAHGALGLESCIIALGAAGIIMLISGESIEEALSNVEWTTLSFFAGLFVIVGALAETGVIGMLANGLIDMTGGNVFITMLVLLIGSAVISSFLDNIPFVATMIPILLAMEATGMDVTPLWWAVSLGACLGGNGTLIGASANVVLSDISKKHGYEISFATFFKTGFPIMLLTILIAGVYLVVRFPPA